MTYPLVWERPEDSLRSWRRCPVYLAPPVSLLHTSLLTDLMGRGFAAACASAGAQDPELRFLRVGTLGYASWLPIAAGEGEAAVAAGAAGLAERGKTHYMPGIRQTLSAWRTVDLKALTLNELILELEQRLSGAAGLFELACAARLAATCALDLLQGQVEGARPELVDAALLPEDTPAHGLERVLWHMTRREGTGDLHELDSILEAYGHLRGAHDVARPTWADEPELVLSTLAEYRTGGRPDPALRSQEAAKARENARAALLAAGASPHALACAAEAVRIWEHLGFWVDSALLGELRRTFSEIGRRLARSAVLNVQDDVFWLTLPELLQAARWSPPRPWRRVVAARQAEAQASRHLVPPESLGAAPEGTAPGTISSWIAACLAIGPTWPGWLQTSLALRQDTSLVP